MSFAVCRHCDGVWFSRKDIEGPDIARLPEKSSKPRKTTPPWSTRTCPQCAARLKPENVDGVVIDICPNCGGVWLDPGEYQAARRRSARIRLAKNVPALQPRTSKVGKAFDWVIDFIGDTYEKYLEEIHEERLVLRPFRRKRRDQ